MRVNVQPAYVLHSRPYRDTSAILDVFTAEYGRVSLVARGTKRVSRKGSSAALLQPFIPLLLSFSGRAELKTLVAVESVQGMLALRGERMFSGMYINELLVRLLHRNDAHPRLFAVYDGTLKGLVSSAVVDPVLRKFEMTLLEELGYSFSFGVDGASGQPVNDALWYCYDPEFGLVAIADPPNHLGASFAGADLLAMEEGEFGGPVRLTAKYLLREALAVHLGDTPLRSRELFRASAGKPRRERPQVLRETFASRDSS